MNLAEKPDHTARFAIYYSPEAHTPLWELGTGWIGRDALNDLLVTPRHNVDVSELERQALTCTPAHYGLHATLKAPFELNAGMSYDRLSEKLSAFAAAHRRFRLPPLKLERMDDFVALVPEVPGDRLNAIAHACVETFDEFRTPLEQRELGYRQSTPLTRRQHELLLRWGYPYVMEEFRFHITLTSRGYRNQCDQVIAGLSEGVEKLNRSGVDFNDVCLFYQARRRQPFTLLERFSFAT